MSEDGGGKGAVHAVVGVLAALGMMLARFGDDCGRMGARSARLADDVAVGARFGRHGDGLAARGALLGEGFEGARAGRLGAHGDDLAHAAGSAELRRLGATLDEGATLGDDVFSDVVEESVGVALDVADLADFGEEEDVGPDPFEGTELAGTRAMIAEIESQRRVAVGTMVYDAHVDDPRALSSRVMLDAQLRRRRETALVLVAGSDPRDAQTLTERLTVAELLAFCEAVAPTDDRTCLAVVCEGGDPSCTAEAATLARAGGDRATVDDLIRGLQSRRDASEWAEAIVIYRLGTRGALRLGVSRSPRMSGSAP
ncbi:MAG: hypothetical protein H6721_33255 [Sandaracinus sp.]|nr:hypothetical protein [Sandaracinus sp.]MCB9637002.1 hypothetical protein [Sandaracinus sp.]